MAISLPASSFYAKCFAISPIAAVAAEVLLTLAWWNLAEHGAAPGLAMALWIWPLAWVGCVLMGWAAATWASRYEAPALDGGKLAAAMILNLVSGVLLSGVPIIVSLYAAFMLIIALRVTAS
jgi:hypothetical protein